VKVEPPLWRGSWPGNAARFHRAPAAPLKSISLAGIHS
jgi:hypothetical protein